MKNYLSRLFVIAGVLLTASALAKDVGTIRSNVDLMAAPYSDAKTAGNLSANAHVDVLERRGAWVHVTTADKNGWVKLYQVRIGEGPEKQGSSGLTQLWSAGQTGRSGTQGIVATTGIRGMSAEQLKQAQPNPKEVEKLEQFKANDAQAHALAQSGGLKDREVAALPKPAKSE